MADRDLKAGQLHHGALAPELIERAWRALEPSCSLDAWLERNLEHTRRALATTTPAASHTTGARSPQCRYHGVEAVRALRNDSVPVAFAAWHHGARRGADTALLGAFPQTTILTRERFDYGTASSTPMRRDGPFALLRMQRVLTARGALAYYVDGPSLGDSVAVTMLGHATRIDVGAFRLIAEIDDVRLVPLSTYYAEPDAIELFFHDPIEVSNDDAGALAARVLNQLERHLKAHAPAQCLLPYLAHRDQLSKDRQ